MRRRPEEHPLGLFNLGRPKLNVPTGWKAMGFVYGLFSLAMAVGVIWLLVLLIQWLSGKV